jgi:hypothetical protein
LAHRHIILPITINQDSTPTPGYCIFYTEGNNVLESSCVSLLIQTCLSCHHVNYTYAFPCTWCQHTNRQTSNRQSICWTWKSLLLFYIPLKNFSLIWRRHYLPVKGCKFRPMLSASDGSLGREGSLSCHTCYDTGPWFF